MLPIDLGMSGHPKTTDWLRHKLAQLSIPWLVAIFVGLLAFLSFFLGLLYLATHQPGESKSVLHWWHEAFMVLTTIPLGGAVNESDDWVRSIVQAVTATAGLVLPALFLGSIVFKLLIAPDVFVFRKHIALLDNIAGNPLVPPPGHHLAIRVYSATRLELVDLQARVVLRVREKSKKRTVDRFFEIKPANPAWPIGERHVPHTLRICLADDDAEELYTQDTKGALALKAICGHPVTDGARLLVQISGTTPDLGTTFVESHAFDLLGCVSPNEFADVTPEDGVASKKWAGWPEFDE